MINRIDKSSIKKSYWIIFLLYILVHCFLVAQYENIRKQLELHISLFKPKLYDEGHFMKFKIKIFKKNPGKIIKLHFWRVLVIHKYMYTQTKWEYMILCIYSCMYMTYLSCVWLWRLEGIACCHYCVNSLNLAGFWLHKLKVFLNCFWLSMLISEVLAINLIYISCFWGF